MKLLALVFLFGFAAAYSHDALKRARDEAVLSFLHGMEQVPSLREVLNMPYAEELDKLDDEVKTELGKSLKELIDAVLKEIEDAIDHGKQVKGETLEKIQKIREHLKELHTKIGKKAKDITEKIKEKAKDFFKNLFEKIGLKDAEFSEALYGVAMAESGLKERLKDVLAKLQEKLSIDEIAKYVEEKLGEASEFGQKMADLIRRKGKEGVEQVKMMIKALLRVIGGDKDRRSVKDLYNVIKEYLKDANGEVKEKFDNFLQWVKKVYESGVDAAKDRILNVKKLAREFLDHLKETGKKTAEEGLEFFRPYKHDLGSLWDYLEKSVKETYGMES